MRPQAPSSRWPEAELLAEGTYNVMVAVKGDGCEPVPISKVAGKTKFVPPDHPWIRTARLVGSCLGSKDRDYS